MGVCLLPEPANDRSGCQALCVKGIVGLASSPANLRICLSDFFGNVTLLLVCTPSEFNRALPTVFDVQLNQQWLLLKCVPTALPCRLNADR